MLHAAGLLIGAASLSKVKLGDPLPNDLGGALTPLRFGSPSSRAEIVMRHGMMLASVTA
jgi:hypothetical protein